MDRLRRISALWNWLPVFRAVAETQHLRQAADRLHISPSALSRTLKLLEEDLGQPLFERTGRNLELNAAGQVLLQAVRDAMRLVHDATEQLQGLQLSGPVRISAAGTLTTGFVVPAIEVLHQSHPGIVPMLETGSRPDSAAALLSGDIDVAFASTPIGHPDLVTERLGRSANGVYCGRGHPLHGATEVTAEQLATHPFVAPPAQHGVPVEGWPVELPRTVAVYVNSLHSGLQLCRQGQLLAVLPDVVVAQERDRDALYRLPFDGVGEVLFFACYRRPLGDGGRTQVLLQAIRRVIGERTGVPG